MPSDASEDTSREGDDNRCVKKTVTKSRVSQPKKVPARKDVNDAHEDHASGKAFFHPPGGAGSSRLPSSSSNPNPMPTRFAWVPIPQDHPGVEYYNVTDVALQGGFPGNWQFHPTSNVPRPVQSETLLSTEKSTASLSTSIKEESLKRRERRAHKREAEETARRRESSKLKPFVVQVKPLGVIDSSCDGHLKWQEYIRDMTPRFLDMSIIRYEEQNERSKEKLRDDVRNKFEFVGNEMTDGFMDKIIKTWLRKDRERAKRIHGGKTAAPLRYSDKEWDGLNKHWGLPSTKSQSEKMAEKRQKVQLNPRVGRLGYAGKATKLVGTSIYLHSMDF